MSSAGLSELTDATVNGDPGSVGRLDPVARSEASDIISGLEAGRQGATDPQSSADPPVTIDIPALPAVVWIVIGLVLLALVVWFVLAVYRSRERTRRAGGAEAAAELSDLERQAAAAEQAGDHARAIRLRYRAGVERLQRAGVAGVGASATAGQIAGHVPELPFAEIDSVHSGVAYGRSSAGPDESRAAREQWDAVVEEAGT